MIAIDIDVYSAFAVIFNILIISEQQLYISEIHFFRKMDSKFSEVCVKSQRKRRQQFLCVCKTRF